jgi:hypothetical protein
LEGSYDAANNMVRFKKTYSNAVAWNYWGTYNNNSNSIEGNWGFDEGNAMGQFCFYKL